ncbi:MAG: hypothetical protein AAF958_15270 [Planctomycetota bacterium]
MKSSPRQNPRCPLSSRPWAITTTLVIAITLPLSPTRARAEQPTPDAEQPTRDADQAPAQFGLANGWRVQTRSIDNTAQPTKPSSAPERIVTLPIGWGRSQLIFSDDAWFVTSGRQDNPAKSSPCIFTVTKHRLSDNQIVWQKRFTESARDDQQVFAGRQRAPQSTPLIGNGIIVLVSFGGEMLGINETDGTVRWRKNLIDDCGAMAVPFGFSSSPQIDPDDAESAVMYAGGDVDGGVTDKPEQAGLIRFKIRNGEIDRVTQLDSFSYATPLATEIDGIGVWIVITGRAVVVVDRDTGEIRCRLPLRQADLTNVPSPVAVGDDQIWIAGQGVQASQLLKIKTNDNAGGKWSIEPVWEQTKFQPFYCNTLVARRLIIGADNSTLMFLSAETGAILGQVRRWGISNVLIVDEQLLVLGTEGQWVRLKFKQDRDGRVESLLKVAEGKSLDARTWVAPRVHRGDLWVRGPEDLARVPWNPQTWNPQTPATEKVWLRLDWRGDDQKTNGKKVATPDIVDQILTTYQTQGQAAALKMYQKAKQEKRITRDQMLRLAQAAAGAGLTDVAKMIRNDAK